MRAEVVEKHPFDGPLVLRVDGFERTISQRLAEQIYVRKLDGTNEAAQNDATLRREHSA